MSGEHINDIIVAIDDSGVRVATRVSGKYKDSPMKPGEEYRGDQLGYFDLPREWASWSKGEDGEDVATFNPWGVKTPPKFDEHYEVKGPDAIPRGHYDGVCTKLFVKPLGQKEWQTWAYDSAGCLLPTKGSTMPEHPNMAALVIRAVAKGFKGQLAWSFISYH